MKRPLFISIISVSYLTAGITSFFYAEDIGYVVSTIDMLFCFMMGYGLLSLKNWARLIELFICYAQIIIVLVLIGLLFWVGQYSNLSNAALLALFIGITALNIFILKYLRRADIETLFK